MQKETVCITLLPVPVAVLYMSQTYSPVQTLWGEFNYFGIIAQ